MQYEQTPKWAVARAWGVHLFTASSAVAGFLAILAIFQYRWLTAVFWMVVTMLIDGLDGNLSRRYLVKDILPQFDGSLLDNIVDYQTYVLVPALFTYQQGMVPSTWLVLIPALMLLSSGYQFSQADAKTNDHFFTGFPSYWNVVIIYLYLLQLSPWFNLAVVLLCAAAVFVPVKFLYPSRTVRFRQLTMGLTAVWFLLVFAAIIAPPDIRFWLMLGSLVYVGYYLLLSLYLNR